MQQQPRMQEPRQGEHRHEEEHKRGHAKRIVFVLSNSTQLGDTGKPTGWDIEEFAVPYMLLAKYHKLYFASPKGGKTQFDPASLERAKNNDSVKQVLQDDEARHHWEHTKRLSHINPEHFDAIVFPGGHGPMFDIVNSKECQELVVKHYESGGIIASICHGAAAFVHAKLSNGKNFVEGKRLTCFTDKEEQQAGKDKAVPFLLQSELEKYGARFECSPPGQGKLVVDERLVTGQNPASLTEWVLSLQSLLQQQPRRHDRLEERNDQEDDKPVHHGPFKAPVQLDQPQSFKDQDEIRLSQIASKQGQKAEQHAQQQHQKDEGDSAKKDQKHRKETEKPHEAQRESRVK